MDYEPCYICNSIKFLDRHHLDCQHGKISSETVSLCRRCHRTYHDWGLGSFSPDTTERALEVENKRRLICHLPLMKMDDIERTSYWRKKHGLATRRKAKQHVVSPQLPLFDIDSRIENLASSGTVLATSPGSRHHARLDTGQ